MERFETVKATIVNTKRKVQESAKDFAEISRLKIQISTCEEVIKKNQLEIGQMVFAQYEERVEAEENGEAPCPEELGVEVGKQTEAERFSKQCVAIANAKKAIADLNKQIRAIRKKAKTN